MSVFHDQSAFESSRKYRPKLSMVSSLSMERQSFFETPSSGGPQALLNHRWAYPRLNFFIIIDLNHLNLITNVLFVNSIRSLTNCPGRLRRPPKMDIHSTSRWGNCPPPPASTPLGPCTLLCRSIYDLSQRAKRLLWFAITWAECYKQNKGTDVSSPPSFGSSQR